MNPLRWVRWKLVIGLAVIAGGFMLFGLNPLARRQLNNLGAGGLGARFQLESVNLAPLLGSASFGGFELATPRAEPKEEVARADEIVCDLGMDDLLRKRFAVDEVSVKKPILRIERRKDGTYSVGDIGTEEPEKPAGNPTDWLKALEEWAERLKKRAEERKKSEAEKKKPEVAKKPKEEGARADYSKRITYPYEKNPRAVVRLLKAEALEVQFEDRSGGLKPPPIKNAILEVKNLSDRPENYPDPIQLSLSGEIAGAPIKISGTVDLRRLPETGAAKSDFLLNVSGKGLPLKEVVQALAGDSLPATFEKGTADIDAEVHLLDLEKLSVRGASDKALFALKGVEMKAKPGAKIAGIDGQQFTRVVNEVGEIEVKDLEIGGTLSRPEFHWGDSITNFVKTGGAAVAKKEAGKAVEKGAQKAQDLLDKELEKNPKLKGALPGIDAKKTLKTGTSGALDSLFGKKKTEEKPAPPPAEPAK